MLRDFQEVWGDQIVCQQQVKVIGLLGPGEGLIEVWEQTDILRVWMPFAGNFLEATNNVLGLIGGSVIENDQAVWRAGLRRDRLQSGLQISFPVVNRNDRYQAARAAIGLGKGHGSSVIRSDSEDGLLYPGGFASRAARWFVVDFRAKGEMALAALRWGDEQFLLLMPETFLKMHQIFFEFTLVLAYQSCQLPQGHPFRIQVLSE